MSTVQEDDGVKVVVSAGALSARANSPAVTKADMFARTVEKGDWDLP